MALTYYTPFTIPAPRLRKTEWGAWIRPNSASCALPSQGNALPSQSSALPSQSSTTPLTNTDPPAKRRKNRAKLHIYATTQHRSGSFQDLSIQWHKSHFGCMNHFAHSYTTASNQQPLSSSQPTVPHTANSKQKQTTVHSPNTAASAHATKEWPSGCKPPKNGPEGATKGTHDVSGHLHKLKHIYLTGPYQGSSLKDQKLTEAAPCSSSVQCHTLGH